MTITPPAELTFGTIKDWVYADIVDGVDVDLDPDFVAPTGTCTIIANVSALRVPGSTPASELLRTEYLGIYDNEGYLCTPDPSDPATAGERGIRVVASDCAGVNPTGFTYTATFSLVGANGKKLTRAAKVDVYVPEGDTAYLASFGPVPGAPATGTAAAQAAAATAVAKFNELLPPIDAPLSVYGSSYTTPAHVASDDLYFNRFAEANGADGSTTYGVGGARINHTAFSMLSTGTAPGLLAPVAGALWPGTSTRPGPVVIDTLTNDACHSFDGSVTCAAITGAGGDRYIAGIAATYEAALAIASSESRLEITPGASGVTLTGAGWVSNGAGEASGGLISLNATVGEYAEIAGVVPPQSGPLAGRVYVTMLQYDPSFVPNADITVAVDGVTHYTWTATAWEQYGSNYETTVAIPIDLPVDGAGHTIRLTHAGTGGQYVSLDALFTPSVDPGTIYVLDAPAPRVGLWNAASVAAWKANRLLLLPGIQAAVERFPNAVWVPTTVAQGGMIPADGIHLSELGNQQRADDVTAARRLRLLAGRAA